MEHKFDPYSYESMEGRHHYARDPYTTEFAHHADPYAAEAYHHKEGHFEAHHELEQEHEGAETASAHLDQHHPEVAAPHHTAPHLAAHHQVAPHHAPKMGAHDAQPIHAASTEPHLSSTPKYYDQMFEGHMDGFPVHH